MASSSKVRKALVFAATVAVGAVVLFFALAWATFDVSDVERGSLTYRIAAPASLKSVQLVGECRAATARWKGRDGEAAPFSVLTYGTSSPEADLRRFYASAFEKQSCEAEKPIADTASEPGTGPLLLSMLCRNPEFTSVQVSLGKEPPCREVSVAFVNND
ncbi:hypothetical protein C8239_17840 [Paracidovorax avenae]|uniref:hypothetical protein n=1 Tax=Paracidovorax avenae TaxID=80867 RepID=UPI000D2058A8|nr:hypothetical protein [Paracidovorax avenae]AVS86382.1 hypothetical protein C8239_17840 [Paracidovorax avenae]